jgi:hypothetical protein
MKQLAYIALACLILLNIFLLLGSFHEYKPPSDEFFTTDGTDELTGEWVFEESEGLWFSIPMFQEDPKPGQVLTWDGEKFKWVYFKDLQEMAK